MTKGTSRRRLLTSGAALLAAAGTWSTGSKLLGRSDDEGKPKGAPGGVRRVEHVLSQPSQHWVGDGFLVTSVISPSGDPKLQSPFLLLDHAARRSFAPAVERRGVGEHPHRGFETVTFAYRGEIEHRDSAGGGGVIGAGDVQWMTAGAGVVHEEKHSRRFTEQGGELEMVQLWVNLPARSKRTRPAYQPLLDAQFPRLSLGAARARLIAGALQGKRGPARTYTPITIFDLELMRDGKLAFSLPAKHHVLTFTMEGELRSEDGQLLRAGQLAVWTHGAGSLVRLQGKQGTRALVLSGEPIDEPVAAHGPFVMNTREELIEAVRDYQSGKMGHLPR